MKTLDQIILILVVIALIATTFFITKSYFNNNCKDVIETSIFVDTNWVTVYDTSRVYKPSKPHIIKPKPGDTIYSHDTTFIPINSFVIYNDTVVNDTNLFISITDTIRNSLIISRNPTIINRYPSVTTTITVDKTKLNSIYLGAGAITGPTSGISVNASYNFKRISISAGYAPTAHVTQASVLYRLFSW